MARSVAGSLPLQPVSHSGRAGAYTLRFNFSAVSAAGRRPASQEGGLAGRVGLCRRVLLPLEGSGLNSGRADDTCDEHSLEHSWEPAETGDEVASGGSASWGPGKNFKAL